MEGQGDKTEDAMGAPFNSVSEAQDRVNQLAEHEQELEAKIANLLEEVAAVNDMKMSALRWIRSERVAAANGSNRPVTVEDIEHCQTQRAVLREWALRNGGYARITDVADLIMETTLSQGGKDGVRSSLTNYAKDSDLWKYDSPGVYVLLEAIQSDDARHAARSEENEPESDVEPDGEASPPPPPFAVVSDGQKQCE